jgi:hypothetical protein
MLLEKLMEKFDSATEEVLRNSEAEKNAYSVDVLTPSLTPASQYDSMPILSVFDNNVLARQDDVQTSTHGGMRQPSSTAASPAMSKSAQCGKLTRLEKLRRQLVVMLPSQHDVDLLSEESQGWWLLRRHILPHLVRFPDHDLSRPFDTKSVSVGHPMCIARLLLCCALCIQQLSPKFDSRRLDMKIPLDELMEKITTTVAGAVTSDDELIGSMEGVECLILQGVFQINAGNLRRSWLCFRRAINVAQLMGLHRVSLNSAVDGSVDLPETRRHYMWYQIVKGAS